MSLLSAIQIRIKKHMTTPEGGRTLEADTEIMGGRLTCIVGELGAGKSTLLRMLAGLTRPDEGRILADGDIWFDAAMGLNLSPRARNIGYLFRDLDLFPDTRIEGARLGDLPAKEAAQMEAVMEIFELKSLDWHNPDGRTDGYRQRVAIARAMAARPKLLLLDEPLAELEEDLRASILEKIVAAHRQLDSTTVMVTQNLREALRISDTLIGLKHSHAIACHESHCACAH